MEAFNFEKLIEKTGSKIVMAIPLGAGKPNLIVNEIYNRVKADSSLHLTILTALTLNRPHPTQDLEKRLLEPFFDRVFTDYPNLQYELDRQAHCLPENVEVMEFYFPAGKLMNNVEAQCNYISSNYTHVARDLSERGVNVLAHMVAASEDGESFSLSCNADVTTDLMELLDKSGQQFVFCAQVNKNLPFMYGDGILSKSQIDFVLDNESSHHAVFAPPKMPVPYKDHLIGMYASTLVKDGGELQVGIGSLGDALVYSLLLRQSENENYQKCLQAFNVFDRYKELIQKKGDVAPFTEGLFGATEMFVDGFMHLIKAGILKRKVYDHATLQRLLNEGEITEKVTDQTLFHLLERRAISPDLTEDNFKFLQMFGIFKSELTFKAGTIYLTNGQKIDADLNSDENFRLVIDNCLGDALKNGAIVHGGFFLGCNEFYDWLNNLPDQDRRLIHMKPVTKINQLYGHEELDRLHRKEARFINTCLKMTLSGSAVSDGLEDGRVISGVGGQYNFVSMAQALPDGYSIIQLRSTRGSGAKKQSNIVFNYGHATIPRHLRDIVITEYGIADIRGKSDHEIAAALIEIADSQFQPQLIEQAKSAGKLKASYELPGYAKNNTEKSLQQKLQQLKALNVFPTFPFGTELTEDEISLGKALKSLKVLLSNKPKLISTLIKSFLAKDSSEKYKAELTRMGLFKTANFKELVYKKLILNELNNN